MCGIEEKIYVEPNGQKRTLQLFSAYCEKAQRLGERCSNPEISSREYRLTPTVAHDEARLRAPIRPPPRTRTKSSDIQIEKPTVGRSGPSKFPRRPGGLEKRDIPIETPYGKHLQIKALDEATGQLERANPHTLASTQPDAHTGGIDVLEIEHRPWVPRRFRHPRGRQKVAQLLEKTGDKLSSTAHNKYDEKQYENSRAREFPEIPSEHIPYLDLAESKRQYSQRRKRALMEESSRAASPSPSTPKSVARDSSNSPPGYSTVSNESRLDPSDPFTIQAETKHPRRHRAALEHSHTASQEIHLPWNNMRVYPNPAEIYVWPEEQLREDGDAGKEEEAHGVSEPFSEAAERAMKVASIATLETSHYNNNEVIDRELRGEKQKVQRQDLENHVLDMATLHGRITEDRTTKPHTRDESETTSVAIRWAELKRSLEPLCTPQRHHGDGGVIEYGTARLPTRDELESTTWVSNIEQSISNDILLRGDSAAGEDAHQRTSPLSQKQLQILHEPSAEDRGEREGLEAMPMQERYSQTYNDTFSDNSSYASSVLSMRSMASTFTDFSVNSGYTADEISTATKKVGQIFQKENQQISLYALAAIDPAIEREKLKRNLRRLFKQCAEDLKDEASDQLEYLGARLVSRQATTLAEMIVSKYGGFESVISPRVDEAEKESSSEEESAESFGQTLFADILAFTTFLENSEALRKYGERLDRFVRANSALNGYFKSGNLDLYPERSQGQPEFATIPRTTATFSQTMEGRERALLPQDADAEEGFTDARANSVLKADGELYASTNVARRMQLRWRCRCHRIFVSDVIEQREEGVLKLVSRMQQVIGTKVTVTEVSNTNQPSQARKMYGTAILQIQNAFFQLRSKLSKRTTASLPHHNNGPLVTTASPPPCGSSQQGMLHLLACAHTGRFRKQLSQDRIDSVTCDSMLFRFMRDKYACVRGQTKLLRSLNEVRGIFFVKFRLPLGGNVEVRHHNPCCLASPCECIPPKDRVEPSTQAEYRCIPGPPSVWPPVDPEYLAHLFNEPSCINPNDTWILDQLPRRICGELQGKAGKPAEGWGIYYQEGLNWTLVTLIMVALFVLVSLFGVLWAYLKNDIQGAFGVSSYVFAACGIFLSLIAVNSNKA